MVYKATCPRRHELVNHCLSKDSLVFIFCLSSGPAVTRICQITSAVMTVRLQFVLQLKLTLYDIPPPPPPPKVGVSFRFLRDLSLGPPAVQSQYCTSPKQTRIGSAAALR